MLRGVTAIGLALVFAIGCGAIDDTGELNSSERGAEGLMASPPQCCWAQCRTLIGGWFPNPSHMWGRGKVRDGECAAHALAYCDNQLSGSHYVRSDWANCR